MNSIIILLLYILVINLTAFFTMLYDKKMAIKGNYRVSEKTLFILALVLGGIGIYSGMYIFRHKTKHLKFTVGIPILLILNIITIHYIVKILLLKT